MKKLNLISSLLVIFAAVSSVHAADVGQQLEEAQRLYDVRGSVDQTQTLALVQSALTEAQGLQKYKALVLGASAAWWQAKAHTSSKNARVQLYLKGISYAEQAIQLNPALSSGYLWRAFNTGNYGLETGILKGILTGRMKQMENDLKTVPSKVTADGRPGDLDQNYGARRVLGKLYAKLAIIPGNYYKGLKLLKSAYQQGQHALNYVFYAEALAQGNEDEQNLAKQVLTEVLTLDTSKFDPSSLGEHEFNLNYARAIQHCLDVVNTRSCLSKID